MELVICSEACVQMKKGYCYGYKMGEECIKQSFLSKPKRKNNLSRKPLGRKQF